MFVVVQIKAVGISSNVEETKRDPKFGAKTRFSTRETRVFHSTVIAGVQIRSSTENGV